MSLPQIIVLTLLIFYLIRNKFDYFLLLFLSFTVYSLHIVNGDILLYNRSFEVFGESITIVYIYYSILIVFTIINDFLKTYPRKLSSNSKKLHKLYFYSSVLTLSIVVLQSIYFGTTNKTELKSIPFIHLLYFYSCSLFLISSIFLKNRKHTVVASLLFCFCLIISARAFFVISFVSIIVYLNYNTSFINKKMLKILFLFFSIAFVAIFTRYYDNLLFNNYDSSLVDHLLVYFYSIEFGQISYNLNISTTVSDISHSITNIFSAIIPGFKFLFNLESPRYSGYLFNHYNPGFNYGLGGTFWGELYYLGGFIGVTIGATIICFIILALQSLVSKGNKHTPSTILLLGFLCFYLHRCDVSLVIGFIKNYFIFILFYEILLFIVIYNVNRKPN